MARGFRAVSGAWPEAGTKRSWFLSRYGCLGYTGYKPDGLIYRARFDDDQFSIALFQRSSATIAARRRPTAWLETGVIIEEILDRYEIAI